MKRTLDRIFTDLIGAVAILVCVAILVYVLVHLPQFIEWIYPTDKPAPTVE